MMLGQIITDFAELNVDNTFEIILCQRSEHDNIIDTIDKLRIEELLHFAHNIRLNVAVFRGLVRRVESDTNFFSDLLRTDIARHYHNCVAE